MAIVLETFDLSYGKLKNVNISFNEKTFYSIIGSNNCGKSTLFKLIAGFIPSNNTICCNNIELNRYNINQYIINIGIVERVNKNSFLYKSVLDEMMYPLYNLGYRKISAMTRIQKVLEMFNVTNFLKKDINELNYCEKELLLIMIAILHKPKVLLLDNVLEIFSNEKRIKIINCLKKMVNNDMTIINFTSSLETAYYSDRIILLDNYKVIGEYSPREIYKDDKLFYEHDLEIPFIVDLAIKLKMYNVIDKEYFNMEEMVDDIWP